MSSAAAPPVRKPTGAVRPWVEKYRPAKIDQISSQQSTVQTLQGAMESGTLPHLLFYGPPGTGKTSCALALTKQLYGSEFKRRVLELNASDDRGISVVREKVKMFAQGAVGRGSNAGGAPCPPFKVIILDEADSLTGAAQDALRRTMEKYSQVTRFILICNYVSRIIGPITSRCSKFRFTLLPTEAIKKRLAFVAEQEGVELPAEVESALVKISEGDMRKAITYMQGAWTLYGKAMNAAAVHEIAGTVPAPRITRLWQAIRTMPFEGVQQQIKALMLDGFSAPAILARLQERVIAVNDRILSDRQKALISLKLASTNQRLVDGADEALQLLDACAYMLDTIKSKKPALNVVH
jgi:replication factor C subunit 2/4